ncbi:MAG TPA: LysR substrate-binding domain-containing protein [Xanthobacteraceae bacterium]|nr:LysR substrate-binding domain-containing protein [Xanthobacteraceae bacterium]
MKLHQLRDLVAIADHGSLRAAARHLGMAQPTLTRSLSELERELGAPLFERRSKGMAATALGQAFIRRSIAILNDVRHAREEFAQLRGNAIGSVTIGLSIVAHLRLLTKALRPFRRRYPRVRLHVIEGFYPSLELGLQDGTVDFYIGPDPDLILPPGLHKETVLPGRRAVLARAGHPLAKATSLKDLLDAEWITTSITSKAENELGDLFKRYGLPPPILALQCQSALTLLTSLANSDLLAMAPSQWIESAFASHILTTIRVREEITAPSIVLVQRSDVPLSPAAGHLLDLMRRAAGNVEAPRPSRSATASRRPSRTRRPAAAAADAADSN